MMSNLKFSTSFKNTKNVLGVMTTFDLLPSIEYFHDKAFEDEEDYNISIMFSWLFWCFSITAHWGKSYNK